MRVPQEPVDLMKMENPNMDDMEVPLYFRKPTWSELIVSTCGNPCWHILKGVYGQCFDQEGEQSTHKKDSQLGG